MKKVVKGYSVRYVYVSGRAVKVLTKIVKGGKQKC